MAGTSVGANMAKTAPSKTVTRERSRGASEVHSRAKKLFRAGSISKAQYDKISERAHKLKGKN